MKTGKTLIELATELERQKNWKRDFIADSKALIVYPQNGEIRINTGSMGSEDFDFSVRPLALKQLGDKWGIPSKFVDRLAVEHPDMLAYNLNELMRREPKKSMMRTINGNLRAFLSDRYRTLDNYDLAEAVIPTLAHAQCKVASCEVTENKLYIKGICPGITAEIPPPEGAVMGKGHTFFVEKIQAGITISNSEVGLGRLSIQPAIFTMRCTNYAVYQDASYGKVHLGQRLGKNGEDLWEYLTDETREHSEKSIWMQVSDIVSGAIGGKIFDRIVSSLTGARNDQIDQKKDIPELIEVVGKKYSLTTDERNGVLQQLILGGDLSRFGLHNAVTRHSADVEDYDRATELEAIGGQIIEMPKRDWQVIAKAA